MKKDHTIIVLFLSFLFLFTPFFSQAQPRDLATFFKAQRVNQDSIFDAKFGPEQAKNAFHLSFNKARLAAITNSYILFLNTDDIRANKAANIDFLQNGFVADMPLLGSGIDVAVFDDGKAFANHEEFLINGKTKISDLEYNISLAEQPISRHATAVSGLVAANGIAAFTHAGKTIDKAAQGVIPLAMLKTAGFATNNNGTIYEKILKYNEPISNHSYASNFGWEISAIDVKNKKVTLFYPVDTNTFLNDEETFAGVYLENDLNYDLLVQNNPKLVIVKSAGNYDGIGPNNYDSSWQVTLLHYTSSGYAPLTHSDIIPKNNSFNGAYSITSGSLAKNILVVSAITMPAAELDYKLTTANIVKASFSSVGPRKDGAIKPDLVAVGSELVYPNVGSGQYLVGNGTSFSAPKVTGVVGALTELQRVLISDSFFLFDADQIKALLLHTTLEAGPYPGPDNQFGWGALDAKNAAEVLLAIHNKDAFFIKNTKDLGVNFEKTISARPNEPLKITLSWIDPPFENIPNGLRANLEDRSSRLVNDLDIRLIDTETGDVYFPWKLDLAHVTGPALQGDNNVDNVEQIFLEAPVAYRNYKVVVSDKNALVGSQTYTILITGANEAIVVDDDEEEIKPKEIVIYPTISNGMVNIASPSAVQEVLIFDVSGKLVAKHATAPFTIANLATGLYLVKIKTESGEVVTKKIIKN